MSTEHAEIPGAASMDVQIGRRVHQLMWDRRLNQTHFAPQIGLTRTALNRKLRGERGWSADEISAAARALTVSVGYLFGEERPEQDSNLQPTD